MPLRAIEIDPAQQTVRRIVYTPAQPESTQTIIDLLGGVYAHEDELENGDTLYVHQDARENTANLAFMISSTGETVYGKAILIRFSKQYGQLYTHCRSSIKSIKNGVVFCTAVETETLRSVVRFF